jgi:hypothetical protein
LFKPPRALALAAPPTRRYERRMISAFAVPRALLIATALLLLEGCAGGNSSADLAPAAPQAEAPPPEPAPSTQATPKRGAPAGRNLQGAPAPAAPPPPAQQAAATPEKIKADCWMKYEEDKKVKNIDQRLALVEKCVTDTGRNQPPPPRQ